MNVGDQQYAAGLAHFFGAQRAGDGGASKDPSAAMEAWSAAEQSGHTDASLALAAVSWVQAGKSCTAAVWVHIRRAIRALQKERASIPAGSGAPYDTLILSLRSMMDIAGGGEGQGAGARRPRSASATRRAAQRPSSAFGRLSSPVRTAERPDSVNAVVAAAGSHAVPHRPGTAPRGPAVFSPGRVRPRTAHSRRYSTVSMRDSEEEAEVELAVQELLDDDARLLSMLGLSEFRGVCESVGVDPRQLRPRELEEFRQATHISPPRTGSAATLAGLSTSRSGLGPAGMSSSQGPVEECLDEILNLRRQHYEQMRVSALRSVLKALWAEPRPFSPSRGSLSLLSVVDQVADKEQQRMAHRSARDLQVRRALEREQDLLLARRHKIGTGSAATRTRWRAPHAARDGLQRPSWRVFELLQCSASKKSKGRARFGQSRQSCGNSSCIWPASSTRRRNTSA